MIEWLASSAQQRGKGEAMKTQFDPKLVKAAIAGHPEWDIGTLQTVAFVAAGGGLIGRMYAEQPADAYRDSRAGRAPYGVHELETIRLTLIAMAEYQGLNPHDLPARPRFHNCYVF